MIVMTTGSDEFDNRIHDLAKRENECDNLFEEIKKGNGEQSLRYIALRNSCNIAINWAGRVQIPPDPPFCIRSQEIS